MELMSIAEIVDEIDAYLSLLRTARDFLTGPVDEARLKHSPRGHEGVKLSRKQSPSHGKTPLSKLKSRSTDHESERKAKRRRFKSVVSGPGVLPPKAAVADKAPVSAAAQIPPQAADGCVLPPPGSSAPIKRVRRSAPKAMIHKEPVAIRPAIALAGRLKAGVVVVPAEQVRREREEAARLPVLRRRVPAYGGRLAFEALFNDEPNSPKTSLR